MQHTMQVKSSIHNRFDIEVRDAITGEVKERRYAENIVLDQMYNKLCGGWAYFAYIAYGTGSGTLAASRTSLFSHKGMKAAVNDATNKALPTSWWRRKIVLNPEDEVGTVITEVGIACWSASSDLVTHAMLRDMNGNIVSLTKTSSDIITIYATVYVTFSTSNENIGLCGMPNNNGLVNYLIGGETFPTSYFYTGEADYVLDQYSPTLRSVFALGTSAAVTWIYDVANKKRKTNTLRFAVDASNGHIAEIGLGSSLTAPICRLLLPATGIYAGLDLSGVSVGTGDGVTQNFILPSKNIKQDSVKIKIDGTETTAFTKTLINNVINFRRAHDISNLPTVGMRCAFSADGKVLAVPNPNIETYDIDLSGTVFTSRPKPAVMPAESGYALGVALSSDGSILAVAWSASPYIAVYDWTAGAWVKRANPTTLPTGQANGCALSSDGLVLVVVHANSPYITTYDWTAGAWVKRANPTTLPTSDGKTCSLSSDGSILAVAHISSPYVTVYDWTAGAWVKRANPSPLPYGGCYGCALTPDGSVLATSGSTSPYLTVYDWSGGAWVKRANIPTPTALSGGYSIYCAISPDGKTATLCYYNVSTAFRMYDWANGAWTVRSAYGSAGTTNDSYGTFNPDGTLYIHSSSVFCIYDLHKRQTQITFSTPPGLVTGESVGVGDGTTTLFSLDYTPVSGLAIYLDGVATTAYTRDGTSITFTAAPGSGVVITADYKYAPVITADYTVNGIHKTTARVIDVSAEISFGEGS